MIKNVSEGWKNGHELGRDELGVNSTTDGIRRERTERAAYTAPHGMTSVMNTPKPIQSPAALAEA